MLMMLARLVPTIASSRARPRATDVHDVGLVAPVVATTLPAGAADAQDGRLLAHIIPTRVA